MNESPSFLGRLSKLAEMTLLNGSHKSFDEGVCAMEAVAWLAGEPHSDAPKCTCPVIAGAVRRLNDRISDDDTRTELLRPLLPKLVGSRASRKVMLKRGYVAADMAVRVFLPIALDASGLKEEAARWRSFEEIKDRSSAITARDGIRAQKYAYAAAAAAAAAAYAAYAAADADAAYAAAYAAADAAAAYAADARKAARRKVYQEGVRMIERMLAVTEVSS